MFDFQPNTGGPKPAFYDDLVQAASALVAGETDRIANMANIAALIWQFLPNLNWAGFYRLTEGGLVLGPFCGKPACIRIALGQGVCGQAAISGKTQCVADIHAFPGHIACDNETLSELVVPVKRDGQVIAVIDLDSPLLDRFDKEDVAGVERLSKAIAASI